MRSRCKDKKIMFRNTYQYRGDRCNPSKDIQRASVQNANNDINGSYNWGYQQLSGLYGTNSYLAYTAQTGVPTNQLAYTAQKAYGSTAIRDKIQHGIGNQGRALKGSGPTMQCAGAWCTAYKLRGAAKKSSRRRGIQFVIYRC